MPSLLHLGLAAMLFATASAAPVRSGFTVHQVAKNKGFIRSGPRVNAETYLKYGKSMPKDVAHAFATQQGTVSANPEEYDSEYLSPVTIGGQTLNLDFDTGSADLWVYSSELSASAQKGHDIYDPAKSSTAVKKSGYTWSIVYGDGSSAKGNVYADTVTVGGVTATSQAVELATSLSSAFLADTNNDGLLGLSFSSINTVSPTPQKTFFDNVKATLPSPLFAVTLKKGQPGTYDFGFIDSSKYTGSISYTTVKTSQGFWEFTGTGYAVGSGSYVTSSIDAIADTGTTLLYLPTTIVTAYYAKVSGSSYSSAYGGYIFPCSATLPSFTAGIGTYRGVIPGSYINYAPLQEGSSTCYGGIQRNTGIGKSIYGDIFLKAQYVVFDGSSTPRLGFAQQAGVSA